VQPVTVTRRLQDGKRIELGGRTLIVLHLPGHTPGSIALLEEIPAYRRSMEVLAALEVSIVNPGHGRSFDQFRLHQLTARYLNRS